MDFPGRDGRARICALITAALLLGAGAATAPAQSMDTVPSDDEIFRTVSDVTSFSPRRVGTPGIDRTVDYIARRMRAAGLQRVHVEETPTWSWEAVGHALEVAGRPIDASPVIYSQNPSREAVGDFTTPPGGLRAPVVDIGDASASAMAGKDLRGKIALFDLNFTLPTAGLVPFMEFLHDPDGSMLLAPAALLTANPYITTFTEAVKAAQDAGAVGFVGVLNDYFDSNRYYNEFYRRQIVEIPGVWITKAAGAHVRRLLEDEPERGARLSLQTRKRKVPSHAVVGFLDGRSTDAVMVQSHHDSGFAGAVEDASGVAEVLALADHYGEQPASTRERTLMFVTFDSHFSGYDAHNAFGRRHVLERDPRRDPNRIVANVTLEHIAKASTIGENGELVTSDLAEPRGFFENLGPALKATMIASIRRHDLRRTALLNATPLQPVGIPTDASGWVAAGIPTASLIAGPMYLYDAADTLDKVKKDDLRKVAVISAELIDAIDETPVDALGLLPAAAAEPLGRLFLGALGPSRWGESVDRDAGLDPAPEPGCRPARRGSPVKAARLRRARSGAVLTFRARRSGRLVLAVRHAGSRPRTVRTSRRVRACRRYRIALPRTARSVRISGPGGAVRARS